MKSRLIFAVILLVAAGVQAQPCTPIEMLPAPWPLDRPRGNASSETLWRFHYAGGLYFATYLVSDEAGSRDFAAASADGTNFHLVQLPPGAVWPFPWQTLYLRGQYYAGGDPLMRSQDGMHWQALPLYGALINHAFNWTGEQIVATGELGDVWTSPDGEQWTHRTSVPLPHESLSEHSPMFTGLADRNRLIVGGARFRGYTEDYDNWHLEPGMQSLTSAVGDVIGNGWFFTWVDKTRDGKTWFPAAPYSGLLEHVYFAGRQLIGIAARDLYPERSGKALHLLTTANGDAWNDRLLGEFFSVPGGHVDSYGYVQAWDGKRLLYLMASAGNPVSMRLDDYFLVSTSCADLGDPVMLPAVSHADGANQTQWRTSLALHYPGPGAGEALIQWLPFGQQNPTPQEKRVYFSTGESVEFADVVADLFGASGSGSLRVTSVGPAVVASARTYNDTSTGTLGQEIAPWRWDDGIGKDEEGWLAGLSDSGDLATGFRTNVGVQNLWVNEVEVEVVFRDALARELGRRRALLKAFEGVQWYRPLKDAPAGTASALVRILHGDSRVAAYASRIDNRSGDGSTIRAYRLPWQGTVR